MKRFAVLAFALSLVPLVAQAQQRLDPEVLVGLDRIPFAVRDLELASETWGKLGFSVKPGMPQLTGAQRNHVKFVDGSGIELRTAPEADEGPTSFFFHARDMGKLRNTLEGSPFRYRTVSRTFDHGGLDYLFIDQDNRAPDDGPYLTHPNGAFAMSRVWIATRDGEVLERLLQALGGSTMRARIYAPEGEQATVVTVSNGEVLIIPRDRQLTRDRPVIGATFEVEDLDIVRSRLTRSGIPYAAGGTENMSVIVAPDVTHGMWVEFRE